MVACILFRFKAFYNSLTIFIFLYDWYLMPATWRLIQILNKLRKWYLTPVSNTEQQFSRILLASWFASGAYLMPFACNSPDGSDSGSMASANLNLIDRICADIRSNLLFVFFQAVYSPLTKYGRSCGSAATHSVRGGAGWRKSKTKERISESILWYGSLEELR